MHFQDNSNGHTAFSSGDPVAAKATVKQKKRENIKFQEEFEETPFVIIILVYISYFILNCFGHLRDFLRKTGIEKNKSAIEKNREVSHMALLPLLHTAWERKFVVQALVCAF